MNSNTLQSSQPLISVIIPCRGGEPTINKAIQSVLDQTYANIEILVVRDYALQYVAERKYADTLSTHIKSAFPHIFADTPEKLKIVNGEGRGPGIARDIGILQAKGSLIAFIDDDDIWSQKEKLAMQVAYLQQHPHIEIVGAEKTFFIHEDGTPIKTVEQPTDPKAARKQMLARNPLITSSVLMYRDTYLQTGGFKEMFLAEDYELWLRIGKKGMVISNAPGTSISYTVRNNSASNSKRIRMAWAVFMLVLKYWPYYPVFGIAKSKWGAVKRLVSGK